MHDEVLYISELHLDSKATFDNANRVVNLLKAQGWHVAYGEKPWRFEDEEKRPLFEGWVQWAWEVAQAEEQPFDEVVMRELAKHRFALNEILKPYESQLLGQQAKWQGYLTWLLETPAETITKMLKPEEKKDVSQA